MPDTHTELTSLIANRPALAKASLIIHLPAQSYQIFSNHSGLLEDLEHYFGRLSFWQDTCIPLEDVQPIKVYVSNKQRELIAKTPWIDWAREAGKTGRKDAIFDLNFQQQTLRLLHKVKTDMVFVQPAAGALPQASTNNLPCMAFGPADQHPNQIINFILTQYLNQHLRENWLLGHAAGLQINGKGLAIAGLSGGGKSTLMLHLLENGEHFISNDRVLIRASSTGRLELRGIPKQPRINPGTIVHNPRLHSLITAEQHQQFLAMPNAQLRALEMKFDAPVDELYWQHCYQPQTKLDYLVILNWSATSTDPTRIKHTTLYDSPELVAALMKSPGPFYNDAQGNFLENGITPDPQNYLNHLGHVPVLELNGKVDFEKATDQVLANIDSQINL